MTTKEKLEKVVKLANAMYYAAQSLTTDASRLHKAMEDYYQFIITEYNKQESASKLTWQDIERVVTAENDIIEKYDRAKIDRMPEKEYYTKILERYNELKNGQG